MAAPVITGIPSEVVECVERISRVLGGTPMLAGGWAVACRLRLGRRTHRVTEDLDVVLHQSLRPARDAFSAAGIEQNDREHPCRLTGLPIMVDLLAVENTGGAKPLSDRIEDPDGLRLVVPPFAEALVLDDEHVVLDDGNRRADARLPRAGPLLASKVGTVALEDRSIEKRATDAADALALLDAFGPMAMEADLSDLARTARMALGQLLAEIDYSGLAAQAGLAGKSFPDTAEGVSILIGLLED